MLYGFDIGGSKIAFSVFDQTLNCLFEKQIATPDDYATLLEHIAQMVNLADKKFACVGQVGIGVPGAINAEKRSISCANVAALKGRPLIDDLAVRLGREVNVENDANCFLLSEYFGGSAEGCAIVLGVTLGTGVGGAICINGEILHGKNAFAGEIGHYPIPATLLKKQPDLPEFVCGCGRQMCLETYVSGTGLTNLYQHYGQTVLSGHEIVEKFHGGDAIAKKVMTLYFDILAAGIGTAMLVLDADAIIFGGGVSNVDCLLEQFTQRLPAHLLHTVQLPLVAHAKFGSEGGVRGAALLNYAKVAKGDPL